MIYTKSKKKLIAVLWMAVLGVVALVSKTNAQNLTDLYLTIQGWTLTIFSTGSFNFWVATLSNNLQYLSWQMVDYMWVEDLKASNSGYYADIQVTDLTGSVLGNVISKLNVSIKVTTATPTLISWSANALVAFGPSISTSYVDLSANRIFIKRDAALNSGKTGKYGTLPRLQVTIPAYQAVDTYHGVLTYTLYENA